MIRKRKAAAAPAREPSRWVWIIYGGRSVARNSESEAAAFASSIAGLPVEAWQVSAAARHGGMLRGLRFSYERPEPAAAAARRRPLLKIAPLLLGLPGVHAGEYCRLM